MRFLLFEDIYLLASGTLNENEAPFPSILFWAHILPPRASTIPFDIYRPRPVPAVADLVVNLEKSLGIIPA
jgi:hypothetical protein